MNKYQEIYESLKNQIINGTYKNGERLPSIRQLASRYSCNKGTIIEALKRLEESSYCYSMSRSGYYVIYDIKLEDSKGSPCRLDEIRIYDKYLPYREFKHCMIKATESMTGDLYQYGDSIGLKTLRSSIKEMLADEGVYVSCEQIMITSGSVQGINLLIRLIDYEGKKLLIEEPTYSSLIEMIKFSSVDIERVSRYVNSLISDKDINERKPAYDFDELETKFKRCDYFFIMPNHHNPLGTSLSKEEKKKVIDLAKKHHVTIIEDDYLADFKLDGHCKSIKFYNKDESMFYLRSFSKGFLPGIRIGFMVMPKQYKGCSELLSLKKQTDYCTPLHSQHVLDYYIRTGMYKKHKKRMKDVYSIRLKKIQKFLQGSVPKSIEVAKDSNGIYLYMFTEKQVNLKLLKESLDSRGILVAFMDDFYMNNYVSDIFGIRLCISNYDIVKLIDAIAQILRVLENAMIPRD